MDRRMDDEQLSRVMTAITEGKYSWACILILHLAGDNPALYIPCRTYNRLLRAHSSEQHYVQSMQRSLPIERGNLQTKGTIQMK